MRVPDDLRELAEQLDQARRQKEAAIDAEDFERAAASRDQELQLLRRLAQREREWRAGVDLEAVVGENQRLSGEVQRLQGEVERLRELLRQHGIEPDGGTTQTA
jgi:ATP-dependent Clp protease ATP-binding subunit ClpC